MTIIILEVIAIAVCAYFLGYLNGKTAGRREYIARIDSILTGAGQRYKDWQKKTS